MFRIFYTTQMSASGRQLQERFTKMRSKSGCLSRTAAGISAFALTVMLLCATIAFAAIDGPEISNGTLTVNGKSRGIDIVYIENQKAAHTDSFYVPLRETFEALGYTVHYNVDKSKYADLMGAESFPNYIWGEDLVKTETDMYIYGATERMNAQMPVIEMVSPAGETEYCQIGSKEYFHGYTFTPPLLIDGRAYLPVRAVANIIGGTPNVKWNDGAHDTYYEGAVTFDEGSMTVTVNTDWSAPRELPESECRELYADYEEMMTACCETVEKFFASFENGDGAAARDFCTPEFLERQFNGDMLFYQPRAALVTVYNVSMYTDGNMYVYAKISDDFADREVLFRMARQPGGGYLISAADAVGSYPQNADSGETPANVVTWEAAD